MFKILVYGVLLSLAPAAAFGTCIAGQDINSQATAAACVSTQVDSYATVQYADATGNPTQLQSDPASVQAEVPLDPQMSTPVTTFVLPDASAPVYFTLTRSFFYGPSLVGKVIKLAGKVKVVNGMPYLDDGSVLQASAGKTAGAAARVMLRTDLLSAIPADGAQVIVQGACRKESDGQPSLLPFTNTALTPIQ